MTPVPERRPIGAPTRRSGVAWLHRRVPEAVEQATPRFVPIELMVVGSIIGTIVLNIFLRL